MFDKARDISRKVISFWGGGVHADVQICYLVINPEPELSGVDGVW